MSNWFKEETPSALNWEQFNMTTLRSWELVNKSGKPRALTEALAPTTPTPWECKSPYPKSVYHYALLYDQATRTSPRACKSQSLISRNAFPDRSSSSIDRLLINEANPTAWLRKLRRHLQRENNKQKLLNSDKRSRCLIYYTSRVLKSQTSGIAITVMICSAHQETQT